MNAPVDLVAYARELVKDWPPLTAEQVEAAARILATVERAA